MSWTEVRRSTPAEHVEDVPNLATVWACWVDGDESVTIYHLDDETCHVVHDIAGDVVVREGPMERSEAMDVAEALR